MSQTYIAYHFSIKPLQPANDILIAALGALGFESFEENEKGFSAYIQKKDWHPALLNEVSILHSSEYLIIYEREEIAAVNWNSEWEKNFEPIEIEDTVRIRAPFHPEGDLKYILTIEPKMSFGTGHHETTDLMVQHLLKLDLTNKSVLDMGCGTAVLAILAEKLGATKIDAIDIDPWSYENSLENVARNQCQYITCYEGDASLLQDKSYEVIIANINRNILLQDIPTYASVLKTGGKLLLSGFYREDILLIEEICNKHGLHLVNTLEKNKWVGLLLQ